MSSLAKLLTTDLPITPRHDRWLGLHVDDPFPPEVAAWVAAQMTRPDRDRGGNFSASNTGRCERQQVLKYLRYPEERRYDPAWAHRVQVGHWAHLRWQAQGLTAGWLKQAEVPCVYELYNLRGTMDGVTDLDTGFEFKTIIHPGFNTVIKQGGPKFEHILQVTAYMHATGMDRFSIIYESTYSGEWKEFVVDFDRHLVDQIEDTLAGMTTALDDKRLPPVLDECFDHQGQYRDCPFRKDCLSWAGVNREWPPNRVLKITRS